MTSDDQLRADDPDDDGHELDLRDERERDDDHGVMVAGRPGRQPGDRDTGESEGPGGTGESDGPNHTGESDGRGRLARRERDDLDDEFDAIEAEIEHEIDLRDFAGRHGERDQAERRSRPAEEREGGRRGRGTPGAQLVVHGHFYQPPREDPWTGIVPEQLAAAPYHDWNERITEECYRPNAELGTFEHLSFNVGPTLLSWLGSRHPDVYERIIAADRLTGRAIAQAYGHAILPLCNDHDLRTHVRWGIVDFEHRFGRRPEGMWLPETAVDDRVLAVLAEEGIRFTILAPHQIDAPEPPRSGVHRWRAAERPELGIDLVVYDGPLSHALAFEAPTSARIVDRVIELGDLVVAATDGETFGHHHHGAEEVLARTLALAEPAYGVRVPRLVDLLDDERAPEPARVRTSSWSCAHGVERWKADCGCRTGGEDGWNQAWRGPLRHAFDVLRDWGVEVFERRGRELLRDPWVARDEYLALLLGAVSWDEFAARHIIGDGHQAGVLLDAQRNALLMYTSCGWFFNDVAGIETIQVLKYAARSIDLHQQIGEHPPVDHILDVLAQARSNDPDAGTARDLWFTHVLPG